MPEVRVGAVPVSEVNDGPEARVAVRMARTDDWSSIATLLVELGRGVAAGSGDDPTHRIRFAGHIRQIATVTLVAELDDEVVGVIDMEYHQRLGDHRPQARVHDLIVTDRARGHGAGRALLARAEELARKRGCFRMALVTAAWRDRAIAVYERAGFQDYGRWFVKPLARDVSPGGEPLRDDT